MPEMSEAAMTEPCCPCVKVGDTFGLPPEPPVGAELKVVHRRYSHSCPVGVRVPGVVVGNWDGRDGGQAAMTLLFTIAALELTIIALFLIN